MPRNPPDHRGLKVLAAADDQTIAESSFETPYESALFYLVKKGDVLQSDVEDAYCIYISEDMRHVIDALIFGKATDDMLALGLDIPPLVLPAYRWLFCDRFVFRHALDLSSYVKSMEIPEEFRIYYKTSLEQGPEFLINRLRIGKRPDLDAKETLRSITADLYDRFLTHRGQMLTSETAKEALKWGRAAAGTASVLITKDDSKVENALEDLRLALKTEDLTSTPESAGVDTKEIITG